MPYIYAPYVEPYSPSGETVSGKPLIRIGDSVFNGNPKTGNGLGSHLLHIRQIHDLFIGD
ncbi:MAG: hypothetical protein WBD20_21930 [Pirellulaceae bacterium]